MIKGFKIRIYPTNEQAHKIMYNIGACRFIWNYMLETQKRRSENHENLLFEFDMNKLITNMKKQEEYEWLKKASNASLQQTCRALNLAYKQFFKKEKGCPKFKSKKKSKRSYPVGIRCFHFCEEAVKIPTIGWIKYKTDLKIPLGPNKPFSNIHISYCNDKYFLSFSTECENQTLQLTNKRMGIDLGVKKLAVVACEEEKYTFYNINKSKRVRFIKERLKHTQRSISRKYLASKRKTGEYIRSKNIERELRKMRTLYTRLTNIKINYIHQTTHKLIMLKPQTVVMEDLLVEILAHYNEKMRGKIMEQMFYEFIRQMKYKCDWAGIEFVQADRFYPSSKTCSVCGCINRNLKLTDRIFNCHVCNSSIDRDYNAALNLMRYKAYN